MDTGSQSRRVAPHQSTYGHGESVSEGSSSPVYRWMITRDGNYHEEEPPIPPASPMFHPTHFEGYNNSSKEEQSPTLIPTIDKSHQSDPTTALETRSDRQAPAEDVGWSCTQAEDVGWSGGHAEDVGLSGAQAEDVGVVVLRLMMWGGVMPRCAAVCL